MEQQFGEQYQKAKEQSNDRPPPSLEVIRVDVGTYFSEQLVVGGQLD